MMLRATGGQRIGFLIWEQGARQASLRCNVDALHGLQPNEELTLYWMAEGSFALREAGTFRANTESAARQTVSIAGDEIPVAVALSRGNGVLVAYAFAQGMADAPERLQALLPKEEAPEPRKPQPKVQSHEQSQVQLKDQLWQEALRRGVPWPPPPGLHAIWRDGGWKV